MPISHNQTPTTKTTNELNSKSASTFWQSLHNNLAASLVGATKLLAPPRPILVWVTWVKYSVKLLQVAQHVSKAFCTAVPKYVCSYNLNSFSCVEGLPPPLLRLKWFCSDQAVCFFLPWKVFYHCTAPQHFCSYRTFVCAISYNMYT